MSAAGEHVESDRCRTGVRRQTFCIPRRRFASTFISMSAGKRRARVANFCVRSFLPKKLSKMRVERVRGRRTASPRARTETRTSRSRAAMAPTLRPRTPKKGVDASGDDKTLAEKFVDQIMRKVRLFVPLPTAVPAARAAAGGGGSDDDAHPRCVARARRPIARSSRMSRS